MRCLAISAAFAVGAAQAAAAPHPVVDRLYQCTLIARTTEFPGGFESVPTINAYGQVAFTALRADGVREIRVGCGDTNPRGVPRSHVTARASLIDQSGVQFRQLGPPAIDNSGRVAFWGVRPVPPFAQEAQGLYRARFDSGNTHIEPRIDSRVGDPLSDFVSFFDPLPTGPGSLLFLAQYRIGGTQHGALFRDEAIEFDPEVANVGINAYASDSGGSSAYVLHTTAGNYPDMEDQLNLSGTHVFDALDLPGTFSGISITSNAIPIVSYARFTDTETWQLRVRVADPPAIYVDSTEDPLYASSSPGSSVPTSVNAFAEVAFIAGDAAHSSRRIFVADGDEIQRVLCDNGVFAGFLGARAINSDGQIAFLGSDGGLVGYVVRADPLNGLPTSCVALDDGTPCDDGDPETAAMCSAGACVGESTDLPTSCVELADDTPCDDGNPEVLAFCESNECVSVGGILPTPAATACPEPRFGDAIAFLAVALGTFLRRPRDGGARRPTRESADAQ